LGPATVKMLHLRSSIVRRASRPLNPSINTTSSASLLVPSSRGSIWHYYSTSLPHYSEATEDASADADADDGDEDTAPLPPFVKADARRAAQQYNNRRAAYKDAVSELRKQYAAEIARQRKSDEEAEAKKRAALTRQRLERQRAKNIRSARNAARAEEKRLARAAEFEEELRVAQINRDARRARFAKARQLVVDELEAEAPLWLTTPEEVEAALDKEGEQRLWARPGGVVGAPNPTDDAEFWRYEAHTWDMSKTYITPREELLRELEEMSYVEANVDETYWTEEKLREQKELEDKAKLRAMVREEGRKALLMKQRRMMQDRYAGDKKETDANGLVKAPIPRPMPAPKLNFLANYRAMEEEGVKILKDDPTKFFRFEDEAIAKAAGADSDDVADRATLGRPTGLRDPVREDSSGMLDGTSPYPSLVGRNPRPDTRTEKERKRDEREERMWAAAQEAKGGDKKDSNAIEFAAEETLDDGSDPIDYDAIGNAGDEDDREWEEGLDPDADADILATPRQYRYTEDDVDWVIDKLTDKTKKLEEVVRFEKEARKHEKLAKKESGGDDGEEDADEEISDEIADAVGVASTTKIEGVDERGRKFVQYDLDDDGDATADAFDLDTDAQNLLSEIDALQETLTAEQLDAIKSMDMSELDMMTDELISSDDIADALRKVPGLSEDQIQAMVELEESLESNESIRKAVAPHNVSELNEVDELLASDEGLRKAFEAGDKKQMEIELERLLGEGKMD